jgi:hypothetical protein
MSRYDGILGPSEKERLAWKILEEAKGDINLVYEGNQLFSNGRLLAKPDSLRDYADVLGLLAEMWEREAQQVEGTSEMMRLGLRADRAKTFATRLTQEAEVTPSQIVIVRY